MLVQRAHIEVGIVLVDHFIFESLPELGFPCAPIALPESQERSPHLPVCTEKRVCGAVWLVALEPVPEPVGKLL